MRRPRKRKSFSPLLLLSLTFGVGLPRVSLAEDLQGSISAAQSVGNQNPQPGTALNPSELALQRQKRLQMMQDLGKQADASKPMAPSAEYAERVRKAVRSRFTEADGNLTSMDAVIEVTCAPSGTILSASIVAPSGDTQWDDAALEAVRKTNPMPLDVTGTIPPKFKITLRPTRQISLQERTTQNLQKKVSRNCKRIITVVPGPEPHVRSVCAPAEHS